MSAQPKKILAISGLDPVSQQLCLYNTRDIKNHNCPIFVKTEPVKDKLDLNLVTKEFYNDKSIT